MKIQKNREIERLRALAVLMVVFAHVTPPIADWAMIFRHPRTGVDIFFVVSGFVVSRSLLRQLPDLHGVADVGEAFNRSLGALKAFYARRFFRIFPLAAAVVGLQYVLHIFGTPVGGDMDGFWREVFAVFTGVYNYSAPEEGYNQLGVYWSLSVEEHFYLLLPLGFLFCRSRAQRIGLSVAGVALVAFGLRPFFDPPPPGWASPQYYPIMASHLCFDALLAGVAAALLFEGPRAKPFLPPRLLQWIILPACLALIWAIPCALPAHTYVHQGFIAAWVLSAILVTYASFGSGYVFELPILRSALEHVGARSYAIYLLHIPTLRLADALSAYQPPFAEWRAQHPWSYWALFLCAVLTFAEVSWWLLENPMQRLGRELIASETWPVISKRAYLGVGVFVLVTVALWNSHALTTHFGRKNLALRAVATASPLLWPQFELPGLNDGALESFTCPTGQPGEAPWATIDLGKEQPISKIVLYNRWNSWQDDVLPLTLEVSRDNVEYRQISTRRRAFSKFFPWRATLEATALRYIRIRGTVGKSFCLSEVEAFGR